MVRGLDLFKSHFAAYNSQYVLIGGSACSILLGEADLDFRTTKDLDIVLCVEALDGDFVRAFWAFIRAGRYQVQEKSTGKKQFYRFRNPEDTSYPFMLELFTRKPDMLNIAEGSQLTPIPIDEDVSSLSAILLNDDYYEFIKRGILYIDELPLVPAEYLIPLKAIAWLDLSQRKADGKGVDSSDIKKHKIDVFRLYQLLTPTTVIVLPESIREDMKRFVETVAEDSAVNTKQLKIRASADEVLAAIKRTYALK